MKCKSKVEENSYSTFFFVYKRHKKKRFHCYFFYNEGGLGEAVNFPSTIPGLFEVPSNTVLAGNFGLAV